MVIKSKTRNNDTILLCRYDFFYLNDGTNGWDSYSGVYPYGDGSVDSIFSPVRTPSNFIYLQFQSDNSVNKKGWMVNYRIGKVQHKLDMNEMGHDIT